METLVFALEEAAARISAKCPESAADKPKAVRASVTILKHLLLLDDQFCIGGVQFQEFVDILQSGLRPLD